MRMSLFLASTISLIGISAFAAPAVDITSYTYESANSHVAELCGRATGITAPAVVHATVDVGSRHPANYNTIVDGDGQFCMVVITYRGTATVTLGGATAQAPLATRP